MLDALAPAGVFEIAMACEDVETHWHLHVGRGIPEFIVVVGVEGKVRVRYFPDRDAVEAAFLAALHLGDAAVGVVERDRGAADQTMRRDAAIIHQPIVVDAEAGFLHARVVEREEAERERRVEHLGAEAVGLHLLDARVRVLPAGMSLEAFADRDRLEARSVGAKRFGYALFPKVVW